MTGRSDESTYGPNLRRAELPPRERRPDKAVPTSTRAETEPTTPEAPTLPARTSVRTGRLAARCDDRSTAGAPTSPTRLADGPDAAPVAAGPALRRALPPADSRELAAVEVSLPPPRRYPLIATGPTPSRISTAATAGPCARTVPGTAAPTPPVVTADPAVLAEPRTGPTTDADGEPVVTAPVTLRVLRDSPALSVHVCGCPVRPTAAEACLSSTYRKPRTVERTQPRAPLRAMKGRPSDAP